MTSKAVGTKPISFQTPLIILSVGINLLFVIAGIIWMVRCENRNSLACNYDLHTAEAKVVTHIISPAGTPIGRNPTWLNEEEIITFKKQHLEDDLLEIYNLKSQSWRIVNLEGMHCEAESTEIKIDQILPLHNRNVAVQRSCPEYNRQTAIFELVSNREPYQFHKLYQTDQLRPFHGQLAPAPDLSKMVVINSYDKEAFIQSFSQNFWNVQPVGQELNLKKHSSASWSQDGTEIALSADNSKIFGESFAIYLIDTKTWESTKLFESVTNLYNLQWSADGKELLFTGTIRNQEGIWILNQERQVIRFVYPLESSRVKDVSWSPSNQFILLENQFENPDPNKPPERGVEIIELSKG